jgi:hypothetical protein
MVNHDKNHVLIEIIEGRLQFLIAFSTFFPSLVFFTFVWLGQQDKDASNAAVLWSSPIAYYILAYLFFQFVKKSLKEEWLKVINGLLIFGIGSFAIPVGYMSARRSSWFPNYDEFILKIGLLSIQLAPVILLLIVFVSSCYYFFKKKAI